MTASCVFVENYHNCHKVSSNKFTDPFQLFLLPPKAKTVIFNKAYCSHRTLTAIRNNPNTVSCTGKSLKILH